MIRKKEDAWITEFLPQHTAKGRRLYHRKQSYTPLQRLTTDMFDRFRDEGGLYSESPEVITAKEGGFIISFMERDGKHKGLGYREDYMGNEINLETPWCPTRRDADGLLNQWIRAYNK